MSILDRIKHLCFITLRIKKYDFLSDQIFIKGKPIKYQPLLVKGLGEIGFGKNVQIGVSSSPCFFSHYAYIEARKESSKIVIGNNVALNNAISICALSTIEIADNVLIGVNCSIIDSDFHNLAVNKRHDNEVSAMPIYIEKNVFIGSNVTILKGVTIGENSVIGNGSIVTKNIPKNVVAAGNPARVIRNL